jgi:hypothetical protein
VQKNHHQTKTSTAPNAVVIPVMRVQVGGGVGSVSNFTLTISTNPTTSSSLLLTRLWGFAMGRQTYALLSFPCIVALGIRLAFSAATFLCVFA